MSRTERIGKVIQRYLTAHSASMVPYSAKPVTYLTSKKHRIASFLDKSDPNVDWKTVRSFGEEWSKFDSFSDVELSRIGDDYFDIVTHDMISMDTIALDVGCGSGRWTKYLAPKVKYVEAIDPSPAVMSASTFLSSLQNVRVTQATVNHLPFANNSFDFVYSLGVLHHLPETEAAIKNCSEKLKPGGWFLLYLYYNLDNRSAGYKMIFFVSNALRKLVSQLPGTTKRIVSDLIASFIYWPFVQVGHLVSVFSERLASNLPLAYYRRVGFRIMRNDALDRFGTPLEKRFSRAEVEQMLVRTGFQNIVFSLNPPYWHVVGQKK